MAVGIFEETKQWLIPFVANAKLQSAFLDYTKLPGGYEKLNDLSAYVRREAHFSCPLKLLCSIDPAGQYKIASTNHSQLPNGWLHFSELQMGQNTLTLVWTPENLARLLLLLLLFSLQFLDLGNAIRAGKPPPPNKLLHIDPIMAALTEAKEKRLDEISSVVIVAEAADEFPQYILKKILDLATDKRNILNELVRI